MTAVSYHDTINVLQGLPFAGRGPFARIQWFTLLEETGAKPLVALARDGTDALALILTKGANGLEPLTNWYAFTWSDIATSAADRDALLETLARDLSTRASRVVLSKLADEDGTAPRLERAFRGAGRAGPRPYQPAPQARPGCAHRGRQRVEPAHSDTCAARDAGAR